MTLTLQLPPDLEQRVNAEAARRGLTPEAYALEVLKTTMPDPPAVNEVLTREEIEARFDREWVLVGDPELDKDLEVVRGKVLWHSKDRDEVYQKSIDLRPKRGAFLYIGPWPENMEYVL
jgi:hypothetical protein